MPIRSLHVVHLLVRHNRTDGSTGFLLYPHEHWKAPDGERYLALPSKKTVDNPLAEFIQGTPLDTYIDRIVIDEWGLPPSAYTVDQEFEAAEWTLPSAGRKDEEFRPVPTSYTVYPVEIWVHPEHREPLRQRLDGRWLTPDEALAEPWLSPTARGVFAELKRRHSSFHANPPAPEQKRCAREANALARLHGPVSDEPSMDALAREWLSHNLHGIRHLTREKLNEILDAGDRAFNLRVADPYLRYQMQGQGFTWSFFTHKDKQDCHVHGSPVVEIYGILEGEMEIWSKPYYERGTSAWSHRVLKPGDWLEVDSLQCHIVHWRSPGKGVVFKAGPGPLAEVGKLGVKGKTPCTDCPCMKPERVRALEPKTAQEAVGG